MHPNPRWGFPPGNVHRFPPSHGTFHQRGPAPQGGPPHGRGAFLQRGPQRGPGPQHQMFSGPPPPMGQQDQNQNRYISPRQMRPQMGHQHQYRPFQGPPSGPNAGPSNFNRHPGQFQGRPRFNQGQKPQDGKQWKPKQKVDKRDLAENNRFYCDGCDRGYKDEDKYQAHVQSHEKCPEAGCSYIAASKLVELHVRLQHRSGLAKKIWAVESPEDIKKWRDERKKNFPTAENVAKRNAIQADKIARGEVIEEKYFGKMKRGRNNRGRGRGGRRSFEGKEDNNNKRKMATTDGADCTGEKQLKTDVNMEDGADSLSLFFGAGDSDSNSAKEDDGDKLAATSTLPNVVAAGGLGSLIASYSDSEAEEDDTSTKGENSKDKERKHFKDNYDRKRQNRRGRKNKNKDKQSSDKKVDKSLLEKLLAKEIRQERNKILQCVHFIVKNNFFDKTDKETNESVNT